MLDESQSASSPPVVPEERRRLILAMLAERGSVTVGTVERAFGISSMTARRDLAILAQEGRACDARRRRAAGARESRRPFRSRPTRTEQKRRINARSRGRAGRDDLRRPPRRATSREHLLLGGADVVDELAARDEPFPAETRPGARPRRALPRLTQSSSAPRQAIEGFTPPRRFSVGHLRRGFRLTDRARGRGRAP